MPDRKSYFPAGSVEETRQRIEIAVRHGEGLTLVFGQSGIGKTLLLRLLQQSLTAEYQTAYFSGGRIDTSQDLIAQILHLFQIPYPADETAAAPTVPMTMRLRFRDFVQQESANAVLLFIDEAQHLSFEVLEELRLLTDSADGMPPKFRVVLAGTMELEEKLADPKLEPFCQRILTRCYLEPFTADETYRYLTAQTGMLADGAKRRVHTLTEGVPRLINQLCRIALQTAYKEVPLAEADILAAWGGLQHLGTDAVAAVIPAGESRTPLAPEEIDKIVNHKKKTFLLRQFDTIEFGTLNEPNTAAEPPKKAEIKLRAYEEENYKPAYPEDEDEESEEIGGLMAPPAVHTDGLPPPARADVPRKLTLNYIRCDRKIRRRNVLQKVLHRLGMFASFLLPQKAEPELPPSDTMPSDTMPDDIVSDDMVMEANTLTESGTTEIGTTEVGAALPENEPDRIGISYSDFLKRKSEIRETETVLPVFRASLHAAPFGSAWQKNRLDETFDESVKVEKPPVALTDLFRTRSLTVPPAAASANAKETDGGIVQQQLNTIIQRITQAVEKIERAAEASERAGVHITQSAQFVETEVRGMVPAYLGFFQQLSDFQQTLSAELDAVRNRTDINRLRMPPRRHIEIERRLPVIDVESLFK